MGINKLSSKIIGAAIEVHKAFGPGLLESLYFPASHRKVKKDNPLRSLRLCGELLLLYGQPSDTGLCPFYTRT